MPKDLIGKIWLKQKNKIVLTLILLVILDILVFWQIKNLVSLNKPLEIYFLKVGQGDSELIKLSGKVKILIDGGPANNQILENLNQILSPFDRYLDLVILSHPQSDHFGGLIEVFKRYQVGAFIYNGRDNPIPAFEELKKVVAENKIQTIVLIGGDKIRYQDNQFNFLLPDLSLLQSKELNDTALVGELKNSNFKALFTGDISSKIEKKLITFYHSTIDVLKVSHHGSKFSSSPEFLNALRPKVAVIEVGKNSYGHPTKDVLERLKAVGAKILRTDQEGLVELLIDGQKIRIFQNF